MGNKPSSFTEELRDGIWDLHVKWFSERQIARALKISKTDVHHHLQTILQRKARDFDRDKSRAVRQKSYYAQLRDGFAFAISETMINYSRAIKEYEDQVATGKHPSVARTTIPPLVALVSALDKMPAHLGLIVPTPDQVYTEEQWKTLHEQQEKLLEIEQNKKLEPQALPRFKNTP